MASGFRPTGRRGVLFTVGLLFWASGAGTASADVKTIEAKAGNVWDPTPVAAAAGDVVEWKLGAGTHGVRITNWAAVKDHLEVEMVAGQEPFDAAAGRNTNSTSTAGKVLLRVKVKTVPPAPAEITYNCIVHGAGMAGKVTVAAAPAPKPNPIPNVKLKDQDGKELSLHDELIQRKCVIVNLMYTQCEACERGTKNLAQVQKALGDQLGRDVFIYSITIDPTNDTPEVLKAYAEKHGVRPGWKFLTGNEKDLDAIRRGLGLTGLSAEMRAKIGGAAKASDQDPGKKLHTSKMVVGYDAYNRWGMIDTLARPDQILQLIERLKPPPKR